MEIGKSMAKVRKAKGYTQAEIAEYLQTTQQQYSKYETEKQEPSARVIKQLCELYKVSANKLLGIDIYISEKDEPKIIEKLIFETEDLIYWAEDRGHITEDAKYLLLQNFTEIIKKAKNEL